MPAWLYKSGKLYDVDENHGLLLRDKFGKSGVVSDAIKEGFVRIRIHHNMLAIQANSKDLVRSAANKLFCEKIPNLALLDNVALEFPGRYIEMCFGDFLNWIKYEAIPEIIDVDVVDEDGTVKANQ